MKLLFDENLSRKLVLRLSDLYPDSLHVCSVDLLTSPDVDVWAFTGKKGFLVVSADGDFFDIATKYGPPPKLIWLRHWDRPTRDAEYSLRGRQLRSRSLLVNLSRWCWCLTIIELGNRA